MLLDLILFYCIISWLIGLGRMVKVYDGNILSTIFHVIISPLAIPIVIGLKM